MGAPRLSRRRARNLLTTVGVGAIAVSFVLAAVELGDEPSSIGFVERSSSVAITSSTTPDRQTPNRASPPASTAPSTTLPAPNPRETTIAASEAPSRAPLSNVLADPDRGAALPEDREARPRPVALQTSEIDVTAYPIRPIGLKPDGELEIPDETQIGWYRYGATAGREGATVLAAHVSWNGTNGPFAQLDRLEPGSQIEVALDDGSLRNYVVTEQALYEKEGLPRERLWRNTGPETLVLITCGGDFNPEIRRFRHNIVVYASPLG